MIILGSVSPGLNRFMVMLKPVISFEELRLRVCTRYEASELVELFELTPEEIFDTYWDENYMIKVEDLLTELDYTDDTG